MNTTSIDQIAVGLNEQRSDLDNVIQTLSVERDAIDQALGALNVKMSAISATQRVTAPRKRVQTSSTRSTKRARIVGMLTDGDKPSAIAEAVGCSVQYVYNVKRSS